MARIFLDNVQKRYGNVAAVAGLTLEVADREFLTLLGPSGCGKTTTLNLVAGLEELSGGRIFFDDQEVSHVPPERRDVAMVFQTYALYPHMTAHQNIAFGLLNRGVRRAEADKRVRSVARELDIEELLHRKPRQLSGGQRQRVALARAIVRDPRAYLLDEPLSNLDAKLRVTMRTELKRLHYELEKTFLYVTHDQAEALTLSDRIAVLNHGLLQQLGTPETIYQRPANEYVASFIGSPPMNLIEGMLAAEGDALLFVADGVRCQLGARVGKRLRDPAARKVRLGVRPEDIVARGPGSTVPVATGRVAVREPIGSDVFLTVELPAGRVKLRAPPDSPWSRGDPVALEFAGERLQLFDRESGISLLE